MLVETASRHPYVNADETPIKVQQKGGCKRSYVWTLVTDQVIAYVFSPTRAQETPNHLLAGTSGFLQVDVRLPYEWAFRGELLGWYDFAYRINGRSDYNGAVLDVYEWQVSRVGAWLERERGGGAEGRSQRPPPADPGAGD